MLQDFLLQDRIGSQMSKLIHTVCIQTSLPVDLIVGLGTLNFFLGLNRTSMRLPKRLEWILSSSEEKTPSGKGTLWLMEHP